MTSDERIVKLLTCLRQAMLLFLEGLEEFLGVSPKTSDLRKMYKREKIGKVTD